MDDTTFDLPSSDQDMDSLEGLSLEELDQRIEEMTASLRNDELNDEKMLTGFTPIDDADDPWPLAFAPPPPPAAASVHSEIDDDAMFDWLRSDELNTATAAAPSVHEDSPWTFPPPPAAMPFDPLSADQDSDSLEGLSLEELDQIIEDLMASLKNDGVDSSEPTVSTAADPVISAACSALENGGIREIVPLGSPQMVSHCVSTGSWTPRSILRITVHFADTLPDRQHRSTLMTQGLLLHDVVYDDSGRLMPCDDILDALWLDEGRCIDGVVDQRDPNTLHFITSPSRNEVAPGLNEWDFGILANGQSVDWIHLSMFDGAVSEESQWTATGTLDANRISNHFLNLNGLAADRTVSVLMAVPPTDNVDDDDTVVFEVEPLITDRAALRAEHTASCSVRGTGSCSVEVDTAYDYNVRIRNSGHSVVDIKSHYAVIDAPADHAEVDPAAYGFEHGQDGVGCVANGIMIVFALVIVALLVKTMVALFRVIKRLVFARTSGPYKQLVNTHGDI